MNGKRLHHLMAIGACLGVAEQVAGMIPDRMQAKAPTVADRAAISAAQAKRDRRAEKLKKLEVCA